MVIKASVGMDETGIEQEKRPSDNLAFHPPLVEDGTGLQPEDIHMGSELKDENASHGAVQSTSVLDQIVLKKMQEKLCSASSVESFPQNAGDTCSQSNDHVEKQTVPSSKCNSSHKLERVNRRKRRKKCHSAAENVVNQLIAKSDSDTFMEEEDVSFESVDVGSHDNALPSRQADSPKAETIGMRFQALNARAGGLKKSSNLFGMMSKFGERGERKRHICGVCGRSFNQLRVLSVHQKMHSIKRNALPGSAGDHEDERNAGLNTGIDSGEGKQVEIASEPTETDTIQSKSGIQKGQEKLVEANNRALSVKKTRAKHKGSELSEPSENSKGYECNTCKKVFKLPSFLRRHEIVHSGEKPFECKYCGKCFGQRATRQRHEATHERSRPYMCQECGEGFSTSGRLERHVKEKHTDAVEDVKSDEVKPKHRPKKSKKVARSEDHPVKEETLGDVANTTEGVQDEETKVYSCPICEKVFHQRSHLTRHSLSHTGEKPFSCKECGKQFSQKATCLRHERSHTGELPFICPECGNGFAQKSGLSIHRLIHRGERPHKCGFCDASFTQKTTCQRHERIHTGEKPFVCPQCGKAFGQNTSLERHVKTHMKGSAKVEEKREEEPPEHSSSN